MLAQVLQQPTHSLALTMEERDSLLHLLRQALGEARVEVHRTHTPAFREVVLGQEVLLRNLIEKLERIPIEPEAISSIGFTGSEEGLPMNHELHIDPRGQFQMPAEELEDFIEFLRESKVYAEIEPAVVVRSGGETYGYGRLIHPFDAESASTLYRMWRSMHESRTAACAIT
jgi:hypothetical protein